MTSFSLGPDFSQQLGGIGTDQTALTNLVADTFADSTHPAGQQPQGFHLAAQLADKVIVSVQADPGNADEALDWLLGATSGPHTGGPEDLQGWAKDSYIGPAWQGPSPERLRPTNGRQAYLVEHILARYKAVWDSMDHVTSEPLDWDSSADGPAKRLAQARLILGPTLLLGYLFTTDQYRAQAWETVEDIIRRVGMTPGPHATGGYMALAAIVETAGPALDEWTHPAPDGEGVFGWGTHWLEIYGMVQNPFERWTFRSACRFTASREWRPSSKRMDHMPKPVRRLVNDISALAQRWAQVGSLRHSTFGYPPALTSLGAMDKYGWFLSEDEV